MLWFDIQDQCYGIVSMGVQYQEALTTCSNNLNSKLARLPLNVSEINVLQRINSLLYNVHISPEQNYWVSGKCKYAMAIYIRSAWNPANMLILIIVYLVMGLWVRDLSCAMGVFIQNDGTLYG